MPTPCQTKCGLNSDGGNRQYEQDCVFCRVVQPILNASPQISREFQISTIMELSAIILAGASVRSLAASASAIGYKPICCDFFNDADLEFCLNSCGGRLLDPIQSFGEIPSQLQHIPTSIPLVWCGGLENYPSILTEIAQTRPLLGTPPEALRTIRNHALLFQFLQNCGFRTPLSVFRPDVVVNSEKKEIKHWICKPISSSGGLGIHRIPNQDPNPPFGISEALHHLNHQLVATDCFLQAFEEGVPMSATYVTNGTSARLIGCCIQLNGLASLNSPDFSFCGSVGPVQLPEESTKNLQSLGQRLLEFAELRGVFGVDFILQHGRLIVLEINPRLTATHEHFDHGSAQPLLQTHLDACTGVPNADITRVSAFAGRSPSRIPTSFRLILYAPQTIRMNMERTQSLMTFRSPRLRLADIPRPESVIAAGTPFLSVSYYNSVNGPTSKSNLNAEARSHAQILQPLDSPGFTNLERRVLPELRGTDVIREVNGLIERFWEHSN
ncbi:MAG: ATP-grasp domain-containing protein [Planctomyces sp.]|nr:ATP-grasp domain-containing protein [Planctomyces sp.]